MYIEWSSPKRWEDPVKDMWRIFLVIDDQDSKELLFWRGEEWKWCKVEKGVGINAVSSSNSCKLLCKASKIEKLGFIYHWKQHCTDPQHGETHWYAHLNTEITERTQLSLFTFVLEENCLEPFLDEAVGAGEVIHEFNFNSKSFETSKQVRFKSIDVKKMLKKKEKVTIASATWSIDGQLVGIATHSHLYIYSV
jgi:hypothetical protein